MRAKNEKKNTKSKHKFTSNLACKNQLAATPSPAALQNDCYPAGELALALIGHLKVFAHLHI